MPGGKYYEFLHRNRIDAITQDVMHKLLDMSNAAFEIKDTPILVKSLRTALNDYIELYLPNPQCTRDDFMRDLEVFTGQYWKITSGAEKLDTSEMTALREKLRRITPDNIEEPENLAAIAEFNKYAKESAEDLAPIIDEIFVKHLGHPPEIKALNPIQKIIADGSNPPPGNPTIGRP